MTGKPKEKLEKLDSMHPRSPTSANNENPFSSQEDASGEVRFDSNIESGDEYNEDPRDDRITQPYSESALDELGTRVKRRNADEMFTLPGGQEASDNLNEDSDLIKIYLQIFWKRKGLVISMTIIMLLLAVAGLFSIKSIYRASGTLLVESESVNLGNIQDVFNQPNPLIYFKTQYAILTSRELAERVINSLNLVDHPEFQKSELDPQGEAQELPLFDRWYLDFYERFQLPDWLPLDEWFPGLQQPTVDKGSARTTMNDSVDIFLKRLDVALLNNSQIFEISFEANDPQLAADIVNTLMQSYMDLDREKLQHIQESTHQRINVELDKAREQLKYAEQALQIYREQEDLLDIEGARTLIASQLAALDSQYLERSNAFDKAEKLYEQARKLSLRSITAGSPLPLALRGDELLDDLIAQQAALRERLNELRSLYMDVHPDIKALEDKLEGLNLIINSRIKTLTAQIKQDFDIAKSDRDSANQLLQATKAKILSINRKGFQLDRLQREVDSHRELIEKLNNRLKESKTASDVSADKASIVDNATPPIEPFKPKRKKLLVAAIVASITFGLLIALLREYFDRTVKTRQDIEKKINIPFLGYLPRLKRNLLFKKNDSPYHYYQSNLQSAFSEAVRSLRTNILFSCVDKTRKIIVVTSACPGEGKTVVSVNLAHALAQSNKVLLMDADMRKPSIADIFGFGEKAAGLSNYAANLCSKMECFYQLENSKLTVMPAGFIPPDPLSLLSSTRFKTLLSSLLEDYNYIVIDSPPLTNVSDTLFLSAYASGTILVVKANETPHKLVQNSIKQLARVQTPLLGAVLNASKEFDGKGYGYGYGYSH